MVLDIVMLGGFVLFLFFIFNGYNKKRMLDHQDEKDV